MIAVFPTLIARLSSVLVQAERQRRARQELHRMDERMLSDIGISRAEALDYARFRRPRGTAHSRS